MMIFFTKFRAFLTTLAFLMAISVSAANASLVKKLDPTVSLGTAQRLALIIGNAAYTSVPELRNTLNDARSVASAAQGLGYEVYLAENTDRLSMNQVINDFLVEIEPGAEILFYYAGHGVELQGSNYLFPIDVPLLTADKERLLRSEAINLSDLLLDFESRSARVTLVILDACRDNPFARPGTRSLGSTRGLARVDPPGGTFVIYAAGAGETALDDLGSQDTISNGLFTRALLKHINRSGVELRSMVRELRQEVRQAALSGAQHSQTPSYYDQLLGDFYFLPAEAEKTQDEKTTCEMLVKEDADQQDIIFSDYTSIISQCEFALSQRPGDRSLQQRLEMAKEQQAFQKAVTSDSPILAEAYIAAFPDGRYLNEVKRHSASLGNLSAPAADKAVDTDETVDVAALSRSIQTELRRTGCYAGTVDGLWGGMSRKAVSEFARFSKLDTLKDDEPSGALLDALKRHANRVCPLTCDARHEVKGEACVLKTCSAGQVLARSGACVAKRVERASSKRQTRTQGGASSNCFMFNGQRHCN